MSTHAYLGDYIQGRFSKCKDANGVLYALNPGDLSEPRIAIPYSYESIFEAVAASRKSFKVWRRQKPSERIAIVKRYRTSLAEKSNDIANCVSFETGKPLWESAEEIQSTLDLIDYFTSLGSQIEQVTENIQSADRNLPQVRFFPRGVFAVISASIQPLLLAHSHFIPALIHGNTVILKASRHAPLSAQWIAEIMHQSGMPSGVFNMVHGNPEAARRLVCHTDVDGVFFVGGPETAQKIHKQVAGSFRKHLVLEVRHKNTAIIWEDAQVKKAISETLFGATVTAGQRATSTGRVLIHKKVFEEVRDGIHSLAKKIRIGSGLSETRPPFMGPLISEEAVENYLRYQGIAVREGCEEIMRGKTLEKDKKGYYVSPSIHWAESFDLKSIYQQSEFMGPNLLLYQVQDLEQVSDILGASSASFVGTVYSSHEIYLKLLDDSRFGIFNWNLPTTSVSYRAPYGTPSGNCAAMGSFSGHQCTYPTISMTCEVDKTFTLPTTMVEG